MRIRLRHPGGQATITLPSTAKIADLENEISAKTGLHDFDLKYGYPPQQLSLQHYMKNRLLSDTGIKFDGEQLIVSQKYPHTLDPPDSVVQQTPRPTPDPQSETTKLPMTEPFTFGEAGTAPQKLSRKLNNPLTLSRKPNEMEQDPPDVPLPARNATLVLRIMPDDNSCLFRAFNTAFFGCMDNMHELRSIIAQGVQADPDTYSAVVLEQTPDDYCRWITTEDSWGGSIELNILSQHFEIEICSIDVQSLRVDHFNEGRPTRCILVYSGIHYDAIALSPSDPPHMHSTTSPDFDMRVFQSSDEEILQTAITLCSNLQKRHYFTDTSKFSIRCTRCSAMMSGERAATLHAKQTGHTDFGEAL